MDRILLFFLLFRYIILSCISMQLKRPSLFLFMKPSGFRLEQLFGSKTRARLLTLFFQNPDKTFYVRELTRRLNTQLNSIRRELKNLVDLGFLDDKGFPGAAVEDGSIRRPKSLADRKRFYGLNENFLLSHDLKGFFKKVHILLKQSLVQEIQANGEVDVLIFTGRFVDNATVPTDLLIIGSIAQNPLQKVVMAVEEEMGCEINYTLMSRDEFQYRRQITDRFLFSILEGEKVVMVDRLQVTGVDPAAAR